MHTSTPPPVPPSPVLTGLGQALRWLRERQARKQYQVANDAGITKGMLSAYETGRQRPSLETLEKLMDTLRCDLNDVHNALQIVNGRPERMKGWHLRDARPDRADLVEFPGLHDFPVPHDPHDPNTEPWPDERPAGHGAHGAYAGHAGHGRHGVDIGQAGHAPGRPESRQRPAYATMPDLGFLARLPGPYPGMPLAGEVRETGSGRPASELYRLLGLLGSNGPLDEAQALAVLPPEEELALAQMLEGFHNLLRYWHRCLAAIAPQGPAEPLGGRGGASEPTAPTEPTKPSTPAEPTTQTVPAAPAASAEEGGGLGERGKRRRKA